MMIIKVKGKAEVKSFIRHSLGIKYSEFGGEKRVSDQYLIQYSITTVVAML